MGRESRGYHWAFMTSLLEGVRGYQRGKECLQFRLLSPISLSQFWATLMWVWLYVALILREIYRAGEWQQHCLPFSYGFSRWIQSSSDDMGGLMATVLRDITIL